MAIYDLRCPSGHVTEVIVSFSAPLPACGVCGGATVKLPSRVSLAGRAVTPRRPEQMPQTWRGTYRGDRDYVTGLRREAEARRAFEQRHPETAGDQRPILAHEGSYEAAPLRQGDPAPVGGHAHPHGHSHGHSHPHPPPG